MILAGGSAAALDAAIGKAKNAKSVRFVSVMTIDHPEIAPRTTTVYWQGRRRK